MTNVTLNVVYSTTPVGSDEMSFEETIALLEARDGTLETLFGVPAVSSGAGFGSRDIQFAFPDWKSAHQAEMKLEAACLPWICWDETKILGGDEPAQPPTPLAKQWEQVIEATARVTLSQLAADAEQFNTAGMMEQHDWVEYTVGDMLENLEDSKPTDPYGFWRDVISKAHALLEQAGGDWPHEPYGIPLEAMTEAQVDDLYERYRNGSVD